MKTFLECMQEAAEQIGWIKGEHFIEQIRGTQIDVLNKAADIYAEQSNSHKPVVMQGLQLNLPSMGEVSDAIEMLAKKSTAPDAETPDWIKADIRNGINWALNYVTKHNTSPAVASSAVGQNGSVRCKYCGKPTAFIETQICINCFHSDD